MKILKAKKNCYVSLRIYPREIYFFQILGIPWDAQFKGKIFFFFFFRLKLGVQTGSLI